MAITTLDQLISASKEHVRIVKTTSRAAVATIPFTTHDLAGSPGAGVLAVGNTTTGLIVTDATSGFPNIAPFPAGSEGVLARVEYGSTVACRMSLFDRIWNAGAVLATALATTTFTPPSISGRVPNGDYSDVEIMLEIAVAISATATTVSVTYTNESGVAGRSTGAISINGFTAGRLVFMPLQTGDEGVQSIQNVIVGGTVATAGSFNVVLARRLWGGRVMVANDADAHGLDRTGLIRVFDDSAFWLVIQPDGTATGIPEIQFTVAAG